MFIQGESVDAEGAATFNVSNPATGEVVDSVPRGGREDAKKAIDAASDAFKVWSERPLIERSRVLLKIAELVRENVEDLATTLTLEQGKPLGEAKSEINSFANTSEYYAGLIGRERGAQTPFSTGEGFFIVTKRPLGVVGAILPWNFPVSLMGWKVAPGLAAGNTFVVKPASTTPLTDIKVASILCKAGLPSGAVNVVTGPGGVVGEELLDNPKIAKIAFTGETATGKRIMEGSAKSIKRLTLELGGSDPMIVCDDADLALAVEGAAWGRFRNCGQSCTSVKRLFLFQSIADEFVKNFAEKVKTIRVGNGLEKSTHMGPVHTGEQRERVESMVEDAEGRGAKDIVKGGRPNEKELANGNFYTPTVLGDVDYDARIAREECFGPALPIFIVKDLEEAIERANDTPYGLGSSVWTRNFERAYHAAERIQAGTTWVNSPPIARAEVPFGGFKQSGFGRELGIEGLDHYFETKSIQVLEYGKGKKWAFPIN
ncbi:MAG TPA: aldehyde dehydrogenase family protein [Nitrososphaerales archaeon]|nr:aldehyde dehydrogenase family protein [Nitrososphaerales archaeon]